MTAGQSLSVRILAGLILFHSAAFSSGGVVMLPVTDGHDIRLTRLSVARESFGSRITSIAQDRHGFLWLGTYDGMYRYDGYNLRPYRRERGNPNSLSDDIVNAVYCDRAGILWVGTGFGGLDRLDPVSDTLTHYRHDQANRGSLSNNAVRCIYQDTGGALWVGTSAGLDRLDPASGTFVHYVNNPQDSGSLSSDTIVHIYEDRLGDLWVGTFEGLNRLDRSTGRFSRFHDPNNPRRPGDDTSDRALSHIREDHSGVLWVGKTLSTLNPKTGSLTRYAFRSQEPGGEVLRDVRATLEDRDGVLWLGTQKGLFSLDRERTQFVRYLENPVNPQSLHDDHIRTLFEDAEGNIWVGTQSGLSWFNPEPSFINFRHEVGNTQGLVDNTIRAVQADSQGALWVATTRGLQRLDLKTGRFTLYRHDPHDPHSLSNNFANVIREDRSGTLWVGTGGGGLNRFDRTTGRFFAYRYEPNNPAGLSSDSVVSLLEDRDGMLWVATAMGLSLLDRRTGRFTTYRHDPGDPHSLPDSEIKTVFEDRAGILWAGSGGGLSRFDRASQRFTTYRHNPQDPASLSHDQVTAIWEDRKGILWVATQDGLNQMDRSRGTFTTFTRKDGLPDNAVQSILEDDQGSLWLATHNGLSQFRPLTRTFRNYSESDGLASNLLNPIGAESSCRGPGGEMWFGSRNGLTSFYPDRISLNPYVPPVVLTDLLLFNKPVRPGANSPLHKPIWEADSLTLTHNQGIFTLEFAALSYAAPDKNRYRYRLEPYESEWNEVDSSRRLATYTSLSSGSYVFRVQASNNDGVWNEQGVALPIIVLPPWWATWWFRSIAGLSIAGLVFGAYRSRVRSLHLGAARLEAQVAQRTGELSERTRELQIAKDAAEAATRAKSAFLANMSHELRTPLNAILGFSSLLRDKQSSSEDRKQLDIINSSGGHLLNLINNVLDAAKIEAGKEELAIGPCDLISLVHDVTEMMRVRAKAKNLAMYCVQPPGLPRHVRADAVKLRQVLINLLGNAIQFTAEGTVTLRMSSAAAENAGSTWIQFEVEDTGIGISPEDQARIFEQFVQGAGQEAREGTGLGLTITRRFVELMGGTIRVESVLGRGSRFIVEVPTELTPVTEGSSAEASRDQRYALGQGQPECRVLVVENNPENAMVLERMLTLAGFQVRVAESGARGIVEFEQWRPHFIWMDLRMPGMSGTEAARRIRELDGGREVKIAAVTASSFVSERDQVLAAGMDDFVTKPYRPKEVFECMARELSVSYRHIEPSIDGTIEYSVALQPKALAALPRQLLRELKDAVISLDRERISAAIGRVAEKEVNVAALLRGLRDRLAYTAIFNAIERAELMVSGGGTLDETASALESKATR